MNSINKVNYKNYTWIDICNPEAEELSGIAKEFNLDIYQINDSWQHGHLPKFEKSNNYNFLILRAFTAGIADRITTVSELSNKVAFFYTDQQLITIRKADFDFLKNVNQNFEKAEQLLIYFIRKIIETYFEPSIFASNKVDEIEQIIFLRDFKKVSLEELYFHKSQTRISRKLLQITQNVINQIQVGEESKTALQDIKDTLLSLLLTYDEMADDMLNLLNTYLSVSSQKNNDVMKLLTIFSAFFLPLTFIAGIYGMNFENMPELKWHGGYFSTIILMVIVSVIIYFWFKKKRIL